MTQLSWTHFIYITASPAHDSKHSPTRLHKVRLVLSDAIFPLESSLSRVIPLP